MRKLVQFILGKSQPTPLSRAQYAKALALVIGLQMLIAIPTIALFLWALPKARLDVQLAALVFMAIGTTMINVRFTKRIDMEHRLVYLFPNVKPKATRFLSVYFALPFALLLPILIYLLQDRKPSEAVRLPLVFRRPFVFMGIYLSGLFIFPLLAWSASSAGISDRPIRNLAYFMQGPAAYYITELAIEANEAQRLGEKIKGAEEGQNLTDHEIRSEGQRFVRSSTGTVLLSVVAVKSAAQKRDREIANQDLPPRIIKLFKNMKAVLDVDSQRPSLIGRMNALNILLPTGAMESSLLLAIDVMMEGWLNSKLISTVDQKFTEVQESASASSETKAAVSAIMSEIRKTRTYREVVSYRDHGFDKLVGILGD